MQHFSPGTLHALLAAAMFAAGPAIASAQGSAPLADSVPDVSPRVSAQPEPAQDQQQQPVISNAPGSNEVRPSIPEVAAECRPGSQDCPPGDTSGDSVITTDDQPLGSTVKRGNGRTVDESDYPTSVGAGSAGSGVTGTTVGPDRGPIIGSGR